VSPLGFVRRFCPNSTESTGPLSTNLGLFLDYCAIKAGLLKRDNLHQLHRCGSPYLLKQYRYIPLWRQIGISLQIMTVICIQELEVNSHLRLKRILAALVGWRGPPARDSRRH
jgi:hypothetical protein